MSKDNLHQCTSGGYLVGDDEWLPADARDYFGALGPFVGCNSLRCTDCGQRVRYALDRWDDPTNSAAELYAAPQWQDIAKRAPRRGLSRLYSCACEALLVVATKQLIPAPDDLDPDQLPAWRCDGHPPLALPGRLEGIDIPANVDWDTVVAASIAVVGAPPLHPHVDILPGFVLTRFYIGLGDETQRDRLSTAVGAHADSTDRNARKGVSLFFAMNPRAKGLDVLVTAWKHAPALYDHQPSPWSSEPTLRDLNLKAVVSRLYALRKLGHPYAEDLATLQWAALTAPGLGRYIHSLASIDPEWTTSHFREILSVQPSNWGALFWSARAPLDVLLDVARWLIAFKHATRDGVLSIFRKQYSNWVAQAEQALISS